MRCIGKRGKAAHRVIWHQGSVVYSSEIQQDPGHPRAARKTDNLFMCLQSRRQMDAAFCC